MKNFYRYVLAVLFFIGTAAVRAADMPVIELQASGEEQSVEVELAGLEEAAGEFFSEIFYYDSFYGGSKFVLFDGNYEMLEGVSLEYTAEQKLMMTVAANVTVEKADYYLATDYGEGEYNDWRNYGLNLFVTLSVAGAAGGGEEDQYAVSAELPETFFPLSDKTQNYTISLEPVKTAMEAREEGLFDKVFPAYTNIYFFNEAGEEFTSAGLSAYTTGENMTVRVPANTVFGKEEFHLGKMNISTSTREDLRVTENYNFTITLSAGETMPVVELEGSSEEQRVNIGTDAFKEAAGEFFADVFMDGSNFVIVPEDSDPEAATAPVDGVTLHYTEAEGLVLTVAPDTYVSKAKYYLVTDFGGEYSDWRNYGLNLYFTLSVLQPVAEEYVAPDIVFESYVLYSPVVMEDYDEQLKEIMTEDLFNKVFTGKSYGFRNLDTGEYIDGVGVNYNKDENNVYNFTFIVFDERVNIENLKVQFVGYDWNTEQPVELGARIVLNLTVKNPSVQTIKGQLPDTKIIYSEDVQTVEISTEGLQRAWNFQDPSYFSQVFVDGNAYLLLSENNELLEDIEMVYSAEKNALVATVAAGALVPEATFCLFDGTNFTDLRDKGFEVTVKLSVEKNAVNEAEDGFAVYATPAGIMVRAEGAQAAVYNLGGSKVAEAAVCGEREFALTQGIYLVRVGDKVVKAVVE